ncbi:MAG: glycosyltransferase, partial [Coriobacteriaceae bacterium]|nr:glycosyltransferase [Coriobacteriaceae bacterium]
MKPAVSIVVPIYNTEAYLEQCLQSIVDQSLTNIEII